MPARAGSKRGRPPWFRSVAERPMKVTFCIRSQSEAGTMDYAGIYRTATRERRRSAACVRRGPSRIRRQIEATSMHQTASLNSCVAVLQASCTGADTALFDAYPVGQDTTPIMSMKVLILDGIPEFPREELRSLSGDFSPQIGRVTLLDD